MAKGITEVHSTRASVRYEAYLVAGVERWQEYVRELAPFNKKPVLFLMLYSTVSANDVARWLRGRYPALFGGDKLLVIHTDLRGNIKTEELEKHGKRLVKLTTPPTP